LFKQNFRFLLPDLFPKKTQGQDPPSSHYFSGLPEGAVSTWFKAMDTDGNGMVNMDELTMSEDRFESLCVLPETLLESDFFTLADANEDGKVSQAEQVEALKKL
jgi:Ca2+-binding EF-hand superfamily protein